MSGIVQPDLTLAGHIARQSTDESTHYPIAKNESTLTNTNKNNRSSQLSTTTNYSSQHGIILSNNNNNKTALTKYIASTSKPSQMVYVVGYNIHNQFTLNESNPFVIDDYVINIHSGKHFNIYQTKHDQFYVSGYNQNGECAIENEDDISSNPRNIKFKTFTEINYFRNKDNKMKIIKVCTNSTSNNTSG